jgi:FkbM family methyltransferase
LPFGFSISGDLRLAGFQHQQALTFFDVGANRGDFSLRLAYEWPQAQIWAFEPSAATFERLRQRLATCPKTVSGRIQPCQLALGGADQRGPMLLHDFGIDTLSSLHPRTAFTASHGLAAIASTHVDCLPGDAFCEQHGITQIDLLKVDTEGHDLQVLGGFQSLLKAGQVKAVLVEFNQLEAAQPAAGGVEPGAADRPSQDAAATATALVDLARLLEPYGFILFTVHTDYVERQLGLGVWNALFVQRTD